MSVEAARKLIEHLDSRIEESSSGKVFFSDERYTAFPLLPTNFKRIREPKPPNHRLVFVDGGNQEVLGAPNFSIQLNRVYFNTFDSATRVQRVRIPSPIEFFSVTYSVFRDGEICYDTSIFPIRTEEAPLVPNGADLSISSTDRSVMVGMQRADIGRVASIARRFAEWQLASCVAKELGAEDMIIIDGTLQTSFKGESKYLGALVKTTRERDVLLTGLSKTSALFTDTGLSLLGAVIKIAEESSVQGPWYLPIARASTDDHNAVITVAKLHQMAEHIFRFEMNADQYEQLDAGEVENVFASLAANACDLSFPGYPYGLIDADQFARVTDRDISHYQAIMLSEMSKMGKRQKFLRHMGALDAHRLLNLIIG